MWPLLQCVCSFSDLLLQYFPCTMQRPGLKTQPMNDCNLVLVLVKFCPYKITIVHELKQPDYAARIRFCNWLLQNVHSVIVDPQLLFMTDEVVSR
jgi:hypothetical protein